MPGRAANALERRVTLKDVGNAVGVDPSLVSRVLNNDPSASASEATTALILSEAGRLGYRPSLTARGLRLKRTYALGLLVPDLQNPLYVAIATAAEAKARELEYALVTGIHSSGQQEESLSTLLVEERVDGLLVASGSIDNEFMRDLATASRKPIVLVNRRVKGIRSSVVVDDAAGSTLAAEHLLSLGHRRIAGLFGPDEVDTTRRRREGFMQAFAKTGLRPVEIELPSLNASVALQNTLKALSEHPDVTGLFASSLTAGLGALRGARVSARRVPEDLSVVALHDDPIADYLSPRLTCVALPVEEMSYRAVDLLVELVGGGPNRHVIVRDAPSLVLRESTGAYTSTGKRAPRRNSRTP